MTTGVPALVVASGLLGLGFWQLRRLTWKEALLAQIARAEQKEPEALLATALPSYTRVHAAGSFRQGAWVLWGSELRDTSAGPRLGAWLIEPLERLGARPVLVVRGWVPLDPAAASPRPSASVVQPRGEVVVIGYIRPSDRPGLLDLGDAPSAHHFVALDTAAIGKALGLHDQAPFALVALGHATQGHYPAPAEHLPRPRNEHLAYAFTWFGLAAILAAMYAVWAWNIWRPADLASGPSK